MDQALAEPVAASSAPEDQRHRRGRHRAVGMANQALEDPRLAPPAARPGRGRDPLLVGAAQKQPDEGSAVEQPRARERLDQIEIGAVVRRRASAAGMAARISSAISPIRQWSIAVISARSCSVRRCAGSRKKSTRTVGRRSPPAPRAGASAAPAAAAAIGHSSAIIRRGYPISVNFASTQEANAAQMLEGEEAPRGINEHGYEIACPRAERPRTGSRRGSRCAARTATRPILLAAFRLRSARPGRRPPPRPRPSARPSRCRDAIPIRRAQAKRCRRPATADPAEHPRRKRPQPQSRQSRGDRVERGRKHQHHQPGDEPPPRKCRRAGERQCERRPDQPAGRTPVSISWAVANSSTGGRT